jgi:uncharacterized phosphosugar-binding protein
MKVNEMKIALQNRALSRALVLVLLAAAGGANAAAVDVTAVTTDIGAQIASVVAIGAGVLLVMVAVKAFRWVRSALS